MQIILSKPFKRILNFAAFLLGIIYLFGAIREVFAYTILSLGERWSSYSELLISTNHSLIAANIYTLLFVANDVLFAPTYMIMAVLLFVSRNPKHWKRLIICSCSILLLTLISVVAYAEIAELETMINNRKIIVQLLVILYGLYCRILFKKEEIVN